ncbi:transporter substrate-binding domain-containing protein [Paracoccus limosus]|jgi:polar amino acid transport system substrate-binding protein|uniref:Transporter substrate-binding domain-containing protein n=1 Tax=Paracoccus limosus TaxID=913252 RepID=A0A844H0K0_9RHOB|nr:transporter substrate-binding domain-containing protein [Paracoccus limosus]MTH34372.1 transporter substrate-binding domain-containing protein [Paracoccus limosus]
MNKLIAALSLATAFFAGAAQAETLKVGFSPEAYPPFWVSSPGGSWTGWEPDFITALCAEAKYDCELVPVAWEGIIPALLNGKIDVIMNSLRINDERRKVIDFSDKYYEVVTQVAAAKDVKMGIEPADMAGKIIGVQVSTGYQTYAQKHYAAEASEIRGYASQDEAYQDLAAGRIDAVLDGAIAMDEFLKTPTGACCDVKGSLPRDVETLGEGYGAGLRKDEPEVKERLNAAIAALRQNGTYAKITAKYFDHDIYGDGQ